MIIITYAIQHFFPAILLKFSYYSQNFARSKTFIYVPYIATPRYTCTIWQVHLLVTYDIKMKHHLSVCPQNEVTLHANLVILASIDSGLGLFVSFDLKLLGVCINKFLRAVVDPPECIIVLFAIIFSCVKF